MKSVITKSVCFIALLVFAAAAASAQSKDPRVGLKPGYMDAGTAARNMELIKNARLTTFELYNLRDDLKQAQDRASQEPERLRAMSERLRAMYQEVLAEGPTWKVPETKKSK